MRSRAPRRVRVGVERGYADAWKRELATAGTARTIDRADHDDASARILKRRLAGLVRSLEHRHEFLREREDASEVEREDFVPRRVGELFQRTPPVGAGVVDEHVCIASARPRNRVDARRTFSFCWSSSTSRSTSDSFCRSAGIAWQEPGPTLSNVSAQINTYLARARERNASRQHCFRRTCSARPRPARRPWRRGW